MADSYVLINQNYQKVFNNYLEIDGKETIVYGKDKIKYGDLIFSSKDDWCLITMIPGDVYYEEVLIKMSHGHKLIYIFIDEDQLECELIVIEKGQIIRKYFNYRDTKELNEDYGKLYFENKIVLNEWCDVDKVISLAFSNPNQFFES